MDKDRAQRAFMEYVAAYDANNPRIALKTHHTLRVAQLCQRIAEGLEMDQADVDLAWLLGLLHDIGRFEQVRRYDTFSDARSVSHAQLGATVLFEPGDNGTPLIRSFEPSGTHDKLIRSAVALHSDYRLPTDLDEQTTRFCNILRDADKIDIIRVNRICPIEDIYGVSSKQMRASEVSPACVECFYQHRCIPRDIRVHPADVLLSHICFAWELCFPVSLQILREQGYLAQMLSQTWDMPQTQKAFDGMAQHMACELGV